MVNRSAEVQVHLLSCKPGSGAGRQDHAGSWAPGADRPVRVRRLAGGPHHDHL